MSSPVLQPLDFEAHSEYVLRVMVENVNSLSNKAPNLPVSSAMVVVSVTNENEAPQFREDPIQILVPESVVPGTLLKSNIAFDPDNSELRYEDTAATHRDPVYETVSEFRKVIVRSLCGRYEIIRDPEKWLDINRDTGDIRAKRTFNMRSPNVKNRIYTAVVKVTGQFIHFI